MLDIGCYDVLEILEFNVFFIKVMDGFKFVMFILFGYV